MSGTPLLVLIRPEGQSKRFLSECEAAFGAPLSALISPILKIVPTNVLVDLSRYKGIIVTSINGVLHGGDLRGKRLYCVGNRTEIAARKAGADVRWMEKTSHALKERLIGENPPGPLVHLRGRHVVETISPPLIETDSVVVYDQVSQPVGSVLRQAICEDMHAVLPLYSPRSALLLGQGVEAVSPHLHVIAISSAVARVWHEQTGTNCEVCDAPEGAEMIKRTVAALRA